MITEKAYAKLNLCLAVRGVREGKHILDSVFCPIEVSDEIELYPADGIEIVYTDGRKYSNDTARKVAEKIKGTYNICGVKAVIEKNIPEGAGLGGSSADAGAVARGLRKMFSLPEIDNELLLSIGSDVPYFYYGGTKRVRGTGETVEEIVLPKLYKAVLVPEGKVGTRECFALYDKVGGEDGNVEEFLLGCENGDIRPFNALRRAAQKLNPQISEAFEIMANIGFICGMSGSGSAVFGLETKEDEFYKKINILRKTAEGFTVYGGND